ELRPGGRICKSSQRPGLHRGRCWPQLELLIMRQARTLCSRHGEEGIGLVCGHIAHAADRQERVGFFWGDDTDTARPDAWCLACERALRAFKGASSEQWFLEARFKIFCARCWDEAKAVCAALPES